MSEAIIKHDAANPLALELTATTPSELEQCQSALLEWCDRKIMSVQHEATELMDSFKEAVTRKWKSSTLKRHADLAQKRVTFYEKIRAALRAGYCIVPNFPITLFAIRTDKTKPAQCYSVGEYFSTKPGLISKQETKMLPAGEGEYHPQNVPKESELLEVIPKDVSNSYSDKYKVATWVENWSDIEFPVNMAKPEIMQATGRAMAQKIFDEIGILPDPKPKKDPMIIGTIIDPAGTKWSRRRVSFIIAWHLNVRDL